MHTKSVSKGTRVVVATGLAIVALLFAAFPASAQTIEYGHTWGGPLWEAAVAVEAHPGGDLFIGGAQYDPQANEWDAFVARLDAVGRVVWDRNLGLATDGYVVDMVRTSGGDLFLLGLLIVNETTFETASFFGKITGDGQLLFLRTLPVITYPTRIAYDPATGGFVVAGMNRGYDVVTVAAIGPEGGLRWARTISPYYAYTASVAVGPSGEVYVALNRNGTVGVTKFAGDGTVLREVALSSSTPASLNHIAVLPDGRLVAVGQLFNASLGGTETWLASFDAALNARWQEWAGSPFLDEYATQIVPLADGTFYVLGQAYAWPSLSYLLYHFDGEGRALHTSALGSADTSSFQIMDGTALPAGGLAISGTTIGTPPHAPVPVDGFAITPLAYPWSDAANPWDWGDGVPEDVPASPWDPEVPVGDFRISQGYQAWYAVIDPPVSGIVVSVGHYQEDPRDRVIDFTSAVAGGTPPYDYRWSFGDGTFSAETAPTHAYDEPGRYRAQLFVTDATWSYGVGAAEVTIFGPPEVLAIYYYPEPAIQNQYTYFSVQAVDPDGGRIAAYAWDWGDGTTDSTVEPYASHVFREARNHTVTVNVTDDEGDWGYLSIVVAVVESVNQPPSACFRWDPGSPAVGTVVYFYASCSYDPDGYIVDWLWDFGDGTVAVGTDYVPHAYQAAGMYEVALTVTDNLGAQGTAFAFIEVRENVPPVAYFWYSPPNATVGQPIYFNGLDSYDPDGYVVEWFWDFGEANATARGPEAWYAYSTGGAHMVELTVWDNSGLSASTWQVIVLNAPPVAAFTTAADAGKVGTPLLFDGTLSYDPDGWITSWWWSFGDGGWAEGPMVEHVYGAPGAYTVSLQVTDDTGGVGVESRGIAVLEPKPPLAIVGWSPARPGVGQEVTFDGTASVDPDGSIETYIWQFGDGAVATGAVATHAYGAAGTYAVKLTVIDEDGLVDDDAASVLVTSTPRVGFRQSPQSPVAKQSVQFTAAGSHDEAGIVSYRWSFGDDTFGSGYQVSHAYAQAGTYRVTLEVTNVYGVTASASRDVVVGPPPSGRVFSYAMQPIAGADVSFMKDGAFVYGTTTAADGTFDIGALPYGTYDVTISREGYEPLRTVVQWTGEETDLGLWVLTPRRDLPVPFALPTEILVGGVGAGLAILGAAAWARARRRRSTRAPVGG